MLRVSFLSHLQAVTLGLKGKVEICSCHHLLNIISIYFYTIKSCV